MNKSVLVLASFYPKKGMEEAVGKVLNGMIIPSRAERGNEIYDLFSETGEDEQVLSYHLLEKYVSAAALVEHQKSDHYCDYRKAIGSLLESPIGVTRLNPIDARI
ncbi:putative quinol monooxygenase [Flexibacterium corallicola]|uniref:putative quinol monooxygenase n=1 Tax=Flexibacterium corallicola TaxID=3037259 RepID=UPI00286EF97E|nr:putative quinol monooxygenase [Pseudovibrio sp. M1P-2-3]